MGTENEDEIKMMLSSLTHESDHVPVHPAVGKYIRKLENDRKRLEEMLNNKCRQELKLIADMSSLKRRVDSEMSLIRKTSEDHGLLSYISQKLLVHEKMVAEKDLLIQQLMADNAYMRSKMVNRTAAHHLSSDCLNSEDGAVDRRSTMSECVLPTPTTITTTTTATTSSSTREMLTKAAPKVKRCRVLVIQRNAIHLDSNFGMSKLPKYRSSQPIAKSHQHHQPLPDYKEYRNLAEKPRAVSTINESENNLAQRTSIVEHQCLKDSVATGLNQRTPTVKCCRCTQLTKQNQQQQSNSNSTEGPSSRCHTSSSFAEKALMMVLKERLILERQITLNAENTRTNEWNSTDGSPDKTTYLCNKRPMSGSGGRSSFPVPSNISPIDVMRGRGNSAGLNVSKSAGSIDPVLFGALQETNEALRLELARLTPLESANDGLEKKVQEVEKSLQEKIKEIQFQTSANSEASKEIKNLKLSMEKLRADNQQVMLTKDKAINQLKTSVKKLSEENEVMHNLQRESRKTIDDLKVTKQNYDQLENKHSALKVKYEDCTNSLRKLEKQNSSLKAATSLPDNNNQLTVYQKRLAQLQKTNDELMSKLNDVNMQNECLREELLDSRSLLSVESSRGFKAEPKLSNRSSQTMDEAADTGRRCTDASTDTSALPSSHLLGTDPSSYVDVWTPSQTNRNGVPMHSYSQIDRLALNEQSSSNSCKPSPSDPSKPEPAGMENDIKTLRDSITVTQQRHRQLEKDYERTLRRLSSKEEELDRLRRRHENLKNTSEILIRDLENKLRRFEKRTELQFLKHEELLLELEMVQVHRTNPSNRVVFRSLSTDPSHRRTITGAPVSSPYLNRQCVNGEVDGCPLAERNGLQSLARTRSLSSCHQQRMTQTDDSLFMDFVASHKHERKEGLGDMHFSTGSNSKDKELLDAASVQSGSIKATKSSKADDQTGLEVEHSMAEGLSKLNARLVTANYSFVPSSSKSASNLLRLEVGKAYLIFGEIHETGFYNGCDIQGNYGLIPSNYVNIVLCPDGDVDRYKIERFLLHGDIQKSDVRVYSRTDEQTDTDQGFRRAAPPTHLNVRSPLSDLKKGQIELEWRAPDLPSLAMIDGYQLLLNGKLYSILQPGDPLRIRLTGINTQQVNTFSVSLISRDGISDARLCYFRFAKDFSLAPMNIRVKSMCQTSCSLRWEAMHSDLSHVVCLNGREVRRMDKGLSRLKLVGLKPSMEYSILINAILPKHLSNNPILNTVELKTSKSLSIVTDPLIQPEGQASQLIVSESTDSTPQRMVDERMMDVSEQQSHHGFVDGPNLYRLQSVAEHLCGANSKPNTDMRVTADDIPSSVLPSTDPSETVGVATSPGHSSELFADRRTVKLYVALYDYEPSTMSPNVESFAEELSFHKAEIIKIHGGLDQDGFYIGELDGMLGYVPGNMVEEATAIDIKTAAVARSNDQTANTPVRILIGKPDLNQVAIAKISPGYSTTPILTDDTTSQHQEHQQQQQQQPQLSTATPNQQSLAVVQNSSVPSARSRSRTWSYYSGASQTDTTNQHGDREADGRPSSTITPTTTTPASMTSDQNSIMQRIRAHIIGTK